MFDGNYSMHSGNQGSGVFSGNTDLHYGDGAGFASAFGFGHVFFWVALAGVAFIAWRMYLVISAVGGVLATIPPA